MRLCVAFLCTALLLINCNSRSAEPPTTLRLPITFKPGYGPFYPGFGMLDAEHTDDPVWGKTYQPVKGIPRYWSMPVKTRLWLNLNQFVYQHAKAGNINPKDYAYLQKAWKWTPDTTQLSAKPIRCCVYIVRGYDEHTGKWAILVDTNNNLDFSDEVPVYPTVIALKEIPDQIKNKRIIHYDNYQNGQVKSASVPITFRYYNGTFLYNFPRYATATVVLNGKQEDLLINPSLSRLDFEGSRIALASSVGSNGRIDEQKLIKTGDEIKLGGVIYRNNGISAADNILELEPVTNTITETNPLQNGHVLKPFADTEFSSGQPINLRSQKGKYVFIDFWHTGCKGCVEDVPNLNRLYQQVDKNKIEFIGINCGDKPERLRAFLQKKQVNWPQILSTAQNDYYQTYRVTGFPTSVLLDQTGRIIARDLHSSVLSDKLAELGL